jgi:hypothetical protein
VDGKLQKSATVAGPKGRFLNRKKTSTASNGTVSSTGNVNTSGGNSATRNATTTSSGESGVIHQETTSVD